MRVRAVGSGSGKEHLMTEDFAHSNDIAVVGMATRVPRARNLVQFWANLRDGIECISDFDDDALLAEGVPTARLRDPKYVKRGGVLDDMEYFDAEFFGFSPKEAAIMDPQHRHFLECAWEALENAGHPPETFSGPIGVYAGCGMNGYFMFNLLTHRELVDSVGLFLLRHTGNDKDFLATRLSYLLNLTGPSINIQNACSTSLVAIHVACQSLLSGECDLALAGGVTIEVPHRQGYIYHDGEVLSPDGYCHAFDHRAQGTVFGSGTGVVVLRRLEDAIADRDHIYAVVKGSAVNNDGSGKVGYLAPGVAGQAAAATEALGAANVDPETVSYMECHGTGTDMGDPIELTAMTEAFGAHTDKTGFCQIGSVKTNIGHLDTAAGVVSFIKAALALYHRQMPPTLNFEAPNPKIDFEGSPFRVNVSLRDWTRGAAPRRAAVNSLGVGGTNAHAILEEAPQRERAPKSKRPYQLLMLSARNKPALDDGAARLSDHLEANPDVELADVAYTLQAGRRAFDVRRVVAAGSHEEAVALLRTNDPQRVFTHRHGGAAKVIFMFPGGGAQYAGMGRDLYESEPVFREQLDRALDALRRKTGNDYGQFFLSPQGDAVAAESLQRQLQQTSFQLPAIFALEFAMAKLWMSYGVQPVGMIGHSLGENTAACLAGVMSFEDALDLVILRGALVERAPGGGMLSVELPEAEVIPLLGDRLDLASINSPQVSVVSGAMEAIEALETELTEKGIESKRLRINVAGHSRMLDPVLDEFRTFLKRIKLNPPTIPFISNKSGDWITPAQATDPEYWVAHLRNTVRFSEGIATLGGMPDHVLLEVGPGRVLSSLARQHPKIKPDRAVLPSLRHPDEDVSDVAFFHTVIGRLWGSGVAIDFESYWKSEPRRRVPLPTYAFRHQKYWYAPCATRDDDQNVATPPRLKSLDDWFWRDAWRQEPVGPMPARDVPRTALVFLDDAGVGERVAERFRRAGDTVVTVTRGDRYFKKSDTEFILAPEYGGDGYNALLRDLVSCGTVPTHIVHLWLVTRDEHARAGSNFFHRTQEQGFFSLLFLLQALGSEGLTAGVHLDVVSSGMQSVRGEALPYPEKATVLGPCKVAPREMPGMTCRSVDIELPAMPTRRFGRRPSQGSTLDTVADLLHQECVSAPGNAILAHREGTRWVQHYEKCPPRSESPQAWTQVRDGGVYVITGGLGGLGFVMAEHLARSAKVRLVLLSRSPVPSGDGFADHLTSRNGHAPTDKMRKIRCLTDLGAEVLPLQTDVTDIEGMRRVVRSVRERFGAINGVIHSAGVVRDDLLQLKAQADIDEVFAPKVQGTLVLDEVLADEPLDFFVLFSSTSTVTAPPGQVDYVGANDFLNAYAVSRAARGQVNTVAVNWGVWKDVGMAAEAFARRDGSDEPNLATGSPVAHPLLDRRVTDAHGTTWLSGRFGAKDHWLVDEHRVSSGQALVPGTGYVEFARIALHAMEQPTQFELRDLYFFRPLLVDDDESIEIRMSLRPVREGYLWEMQSRSSAEGSPGGWATHSQGTLAMHKLDDAPSLQLADLRARCGAPRVARGAGGIRARQYEHVRFGPRWQVLREISLGSAEVLAHAALDQRFHTDLPDYAVHPAMLDCVTSCGLFLSEEGAGGNDLWVPVSYGSIKLHKPMPADVWSWVRVRDTGQPAGEFAVFDVTIVDESGAVVVDIEQYVMKQLPGGFEAVAPADTGQSGGRADGVGARPSSPSELALEHNIREGIRADEGAAAFGRVLHGPYRSRIVVGSIALDDLIRQADKVGGAVDGQTSKFARPELDGEYVAPTDDIERTLAGFWEELLGIERVGIQDSFFDLGGHSLIAVRLFAKIKKTFNVDYPISILFEAPTIERVSVMIREAVGDQAVGGAPAPVRPRRDYLVAMHPGDGGSRTPFFLVAGMFGNVLNLRHLAALLGTDRPFYGIQARGLYGTESPHETFEEMAGAYLEEVRSVQPEGPYLLGGFSGGGITAYEMAQRLRADGQEVALLVMLDSLLPQAPDELTRLDKARVHWQRLMRSGPQYLTTWVRARIEWEWQRRGRRNGATQASDPALFRSEVIEAAFRAALPRYKMAHYPGRVVLFRPKLDQTYVLGPNRVLNVHREFVYSDNGWGNYVDELKVHEVPGDHDSVVLEPNVRVLAKLLAAYVDEAEAAGPRKAPPVSMGAEKARATVDAGY